MDSTTPPAARNPSLITTPLIVVTVVFPIIAAVAIWLRVVARRRAKQPFYADDYFVLASWFLSLALSILVWVYAGKSGVNYYNVDFLTGTEDSLELVYISSVYVQWPLATVKIGVLLFYKRIFATRVFRRFVWAAIAIVTTWGILFFLLVLAQIDPIAFPLTAVSLRFNDTAFGLAQVASSFALDVLVLCLPLPVISRLNMKTRRKLALILIFWLGAFCVVASIVRTVLLDQSIQEVVASDAYQRVSNQSKQYIFLIVEPNTSILAASLPTYGPLFAGGRTPESMFRSFRSFFSIRSGDRTSRKNLGSPSSSKPTWQQLAETESQVEIYPIKDWPGKRLHGVHVSSAEGAGPVPSHLGNGISVTNDISVQTV